MRLGFMGIAGLTFLGVAADAGARELRATPGDWRAVISSAKPGDKVVLTGSFERLVIQGRTFEPALKIDASAAKLISVRINDSSGINWMGGAFSPVDWAGAFYTMGSSNIEVSNISVESDGTVIGLVFRNGHDLVLRDSRMMKPKTGIQLVNVQHVTIVGNKIEGYGGDGLLLSATSDSLISKNSFLDPHLTDPNIHPDAIQGIWAQTSNRDITISDNYVRGDTQGIFFNYNEKFAPPVNITITGNTMILSFANAVVLQNDAAGEVSNNHASTQPGSQYQSGVKVINSPAAVVCGNTSDAYEKWRAIVNDPCRKPKGDQR